jgi:ATP-binding cassette subfamily B protein
MDEATSALDEETEARLIANLSSLSGLTGIFITHRKSLLSICDRTVSLS